MVSRIALSYLTSISRIPKTISPPLLRPHCRLPRTLQPVGHRFAHAIPKPTTPGQGASPSSPDAAKSRKQPEPHYKLVFTCVPCGERSSHQVSKQGYHHGSVLITCPSCRNRHIISDHLNIFGDRKITVEDLLREKGQLVKRGTLGEEGDIEFWEDTPTDSDAADAASSGEGAEDEARRLRETRDPSSQATDPTPSASVLAGDAGTRPSVQGVTQQSPIPSTRRQYHTKSFRPPPSLRESGVSPLDQTELSRSPVKFQPSGRLQRSGVTPIGLLRSSSDNEMQKPSKHLPQLQISSATPTDVLKSPSDNEIQDPFSSTTPIGLLGSSSDNEIHNPFRRAMPIVLLRSSPDNETRKPFKPPRVFRRRGARRIGRVGASSLSDSTQHWEPPGFVWDSGVSPLGRPKLSSDPKIHGSPLSIPMKPFRRPLRLQYNRVPPTGQLESSSNPKAHTSPLSTTTIPFKLPRWLHESDATPIGQPESPVSKSQKTLNPFIRELQKKGATPIGLPRFPSDSEVDTSPSSDLQAPRNISDPAEHISEDAGASRPATAAHDDTNHINSDVSSETEDLKNIPIENLLKIALQRTRGRRTRLRDHQKAYQPMLDQGKGRKINLDLWR
ncbi:DNL zinc finger-domain-containing protein [Xylaria flabelliformis]|nr:DNL zinc finger-domain-containing protein [Xylaria flabelliformis]